MVSYRPYSIISQKIDLIILLLLCTWQLPPWWHQECLQSPRTMRSDCNLPRSEKFQIDNFICSVWFPANLAWSAPPASGVNHLPISKNHLRLIPNSVFLIGFSHLEVQAIFLHRSITHCICPACPLQYIESSGFTFFTFWYHFQNSTCGAHPAYWGVGSRVNWKPQTWRPDKNRTGWSQHKIDVSIFTRNSADGLGNLSKTT